MSDENGPKRYANPEVLPPIPQSVSLAPEVLNLPRGFLGMSIFARARYASEQAQFEAYTRLVQAKNALIHALEEQRRLTVAYVDASEEVRNLDDVRERARLRMRAELEGLRAELDGLRRENSLANVRFEAEEARLQYERDRYLKMREELNAPKEKTASKSKKTMSDALKEVGEEVEDLIRTYDDMRAAFIQRAGGESNLREEDLRLLKQLELVRNNLVNEALADIR